MKARWTPIIFAAGLGAGWFIFGGETPESAEAAGNKSAAPVVRKREARTVNTPHESKFRSFAKELPKLSDEDKKTFEKSLAPKDRAAAIEALLAQPGPNGISSDAIFMIREILKTWAGDDFDGVWAWCQQMENDANRSFVASPLLNELVNKDPDRAFVLYLEMAATDPNFSRDVPLKILNQAASKDAASFLDLLGKLPFGNGCSSGTVNFAADFDFQQAADGVTALVKNHEGNPPPVFPTSFLSTWAARDADAAYAWFSEDPGAVRFENFGSLLKGIDKQGVPEASYAWAAEKLNTPDAARNTMIRSFTEFNSDRRSTVINSIAQAMPDAASRNHFLADVVTMSSYGNPAVQFGYVLSQMSSPELRLETLQRLGKNNKLDATKIPDSQLQQWGLTRQQVEQFQPPGR